MSTRTNAGCRGILARISAYLDGEIDRAACDAIELHCKTCPNCAAVVNGLRETAGLCRRVSTLPLPDDVRERARESVRRLLAGSGP